MAAALDPDEVLHSTAEKDNFVRVTRLLISGGTSLLREIFDKYCPPSQLPTILSSSAIKNQLKAAKLTKPQRDCLYPSTGVYNTSTEFDLTLLLKLLRTICNLIPPITGWDVLPASTDLSFAADLVRIKCFRNSVYGHVNQTMEITNDEFLLLWQEISAILVRIAGHIGPAEKTKWQEATDKFLKDPLTEEDKRNLQELERWYKNDVEVKKSLEDLKIATQCIETTVREEAQEIKEHLGKKLEARIQESNMIETAVRGEAQDIKDRLGEIHKSIGRLSSSAGASESGGARLRLRIDCEAIAESATQGGATTMVVTPQETQTVVPGVTAAPITSNQTLASVTAGLGKEIVGIAGIPSAQDVLNSIAFKCFQTVDTSKPEELNGYVEYLERVRKVLVVGTHSGSLIIIVECSSLQILEELWKDYCTGHLNEMAQKFLVTKDILKEFGLTEMKLTTTIAEEEYRDCQEYFLKHPGVKLGIASTAGQKEQTADWEDSKRGQPGDQDSPPWTSDKPQNGE